MGNSGSTAIKIAAVAGAAPLAIGAAAVAIGAAWSCYSWLDAVDPKPEESAETKPQGPYKSEWVERVEDLSDLVPGKGDELPRDPITDRVGLSHPGEIRILCYNICGNGYFRLPNRMQAIDKLIQKYLPAIILLQEVTPEIYKIFKKCSWWGSYRSSVEPEKATRKCFCLVLSMLPVKKFFYSHFKNTCKGLSAAYIITAERKKLIIATCHLKRPTPPEMNSIERVSQAKEALDRVKSAKNVIIGGDMNWNEDSDGDFPLLDQWNDAWSVLRPDEDGWTYDTESNGMLHHKGELQRRLDRFVCKLQDFEMLSIKRIGMEKIHGVRYKIKGANVPVFPSDHYGLLLTICAK
ncbi:uncharacterized protein LOC109833479 isoform X1 [Asparagus officinalis]|uniref:uncharacterized protein LOC109833479 isoform X1 n=1 Tax=Asparagus officinalis TaxID=4686 RepID=UPI00098E7750|nr:uncharacterized protein LOC109833479 isoform X1 [Asparagus officinalis]